MRPLLTLFLLLGSSGGVCLFPGAAGAQEQERKLMDRIDNPDMNRAFELQKATSFGTNSFGTTGTAHVKEFYYPKKFNSKDFLTGSYGGSKQCWMGDFKYALNAFDTKSLSESGKRFGTKAVATQGANDSTKGYGVKEFGTQTAHFRGKSQDKFDKQGPTALAGPVGYEGTLAPLKSIDDVRDLLNKNK